MQCKQTTKIATRRKRHCLCNRCYVRPRGSTCFGGPKRVCAGTAFSTADVAPPVFTCGGHVVVVSIVRQAPWSVKNCVNMAAEPPPPPPHHTPAVAGAVVVPPPAAAPAPNPFAAPHAAGDAAATSAAPTPAALAPGFGGVTAKAAAPAPGSQWASDLETRRRGQFKAKPMSSQASRRADVLKRQKQKRRDRTRAARNMALGIVPTTVARHDVDTASPFAAGGQAAQASAAPYAGGSGTGSGAGTGAGAGAGGGGGGSTVGSGPSADVDDDGDDAMSVSGTTKGSKRGGKRRGKGRGKKHKSKDEQDATRKFFADQLACHEVQRLLLQLLPPLCPRGWSFSHAVRATVDDRNPAGPQRQGRIQVRRLVRVPQA